MRALPILALMLAAAPAAAAQQLALASVPSRVTDVRTVAVEVATYSEADRLHALGGLGREALAGELRDQLARYGLTITTADRADAIVRNEWVCAGPDAGTIGCSVRLVVRANPAAPTGERQPSHDIWVSPRSVYQRGGWQAMADEATQVVREVTAALGQARGYRDTALSGTRAGATR